jgi:hypothetical protein
MGYKHGPAVDRFAEKVALTDSGCLVWIAGKNNKGYGMFGVGNGRSTSAHRWSYEHHIGPIPEGMYLDHLCRNRACVHPNHLEPVTQRTNLLRGVGVGKSNTRKTHCPAGHPYSGDNLYTPPSRPNRMCRACRRSRKTKEIAS